MRQQGTLVGKWVAETSDTSQSISALFGDDGRMVSIEESGARRAVARLTWHVDEDRLVTRQVSTRNLETSRVNWLTPRRITVSFAEVVTTFNKVAAPVIDRGEEAPV